jgi:hypothetical protein
MCVEHLLIEHLLIRALYPVKKIIMNLEKSKKRISKKAKMGFQGYPTIEITYSRPNTCSANGVLLELVAEEGRSHKPRDLPLQVIYERMRLSNLQ